MGPVVAQLLFTAFGNGNVQIQAKGKISTLAEYDAIVNKARVTIAEMFEQKGGKIEKSPILPVPAEHLLTLGRQADSARV